MNKIYGQLMTYKKRPNNKIMTLTQEKRIMSKPKIVLSGAVETGSAGRKMIPSVTESEEWFTQTAQNSASKIRHRRSSRDILVRLYSCGSPKTANPTDRAPWKKFEVAPREHPKIHEIKKARKRTGKSREMAGNRHGLCPDRSYGSLNLW